jgi:DNA-binding CsgD family transcriptional regulator
MDPQPTGRPFTRVDAAIDCSADVLRETERRGLIVSARFLDPAWEPADFVGRPLAALLEALGGRDVDRVAGAFLQVRSEIFEVHLNVDALEHVPARHDGVFCILSSRPLDEATVRVTVRSIAAVLLADMVEAKMDTVADRRGVSERERQVLKLLLRGRALDEIATALGIALRTVKFHQSNVLHKLGADSRLDLLRVVL